MRSAVWKFCPACRSYRFTWRKNTDGSETWNCQDCGATHDTA